MIVLATGSLAGEAQSAVANNHRVGLICHRTANKDVPENTLESLEQAALLGCDMVEVDVRKTLDGQLVLNHDGYLERLTDGVGEVEQTYFDDLRLRDAGSWMSDRFRGMQIPLLIDALRFAREHEIQLFLDMKDKGTGADVLQIVRREGMLAQVRFGGEWDDVKALYPDANKNGPVSVEPGVTTEQVAALHQQGKTVVANFSANQHEMDLASMQAAVAARVDWINVDYPRLGADAVGRPVEQKLGELIKQANRGESTKRASAILALSHYRGFALQVEFARLLLDSDNAVSRASALALVASRPSPPFATFTTALVSANASARANAASALGALNAPASLFVPLLKDEDPHVLEQVLIALDRMPGDVSAGKLLPLLASPEPGIRAAAALALAKHQPDVAIKALPKQIESETQDMTALHEAWVKRGKTPLTQAEIDRIVLYYRCQVKEMLALTSLRGPAATKVLEDWAFRSSDEFSDMNGILSGFQLWDRIGADAPLAVKQLGSPDVTVADRAEWVLIHAGAVVLPELRAALAVEDAKVRERAIRILALQGDESSIPALNRLRERKPADAAQIDWAIERIHMLHPDS